MIPQTFAESYDRVQELVAIFSQNESRYLSPKYSEAEARIDFIDKFWIALGWDVNHESQTNPYQQDVKVERGVVTNEWRKRADYAFLASNYRDVRFFVEAKKPHSGIDNPVYYFQTIRYGWNSQIPISVLTDFEELRVLDCRYKPNIETVPAFALLKYHYTDYADLESFRTLYYLFSRESVLKGSIESFVEGLPKLSKKAKARGVISDEAQSIDESFLAELDEYRDELARSFKRRNLYLDGHALTEVTQRSLDRLVFMRFLEDKMIESEPLLENLSKGKEPWKNFVATSRRLNRIYNGIIFKEHPLLDGSQFVVDERVFATILGNFAHKNSPYDFNAIPIHILGSIYERFLGKVIVTTDKRARVEEKPEIRKAGGVYYTPDYIVRYIVEKTVGRLIDRKTPEQIRQMKFADIACGSGSFLLGVYDKLLRYHTDYYNRSKKTQTEGLKAGCLQTESGALRLSLLQKRTILLNNIYGIDIDPQAVEVAQLSLYLKLLEDETVGSAQKQQLEMRQALLPSLSENVISGNSLVTWNMVRNGLFDSGEEKKLNPIDFETVFGRVMRSGGFDVIVSNPPYGAEFDTATKKLLRNKYRYQSFQLDSYLLFLERAIQDLVKSDGFLGMIIPNPWLTNLKQDKIRSFVVKNTSVVEIVHFKFPVFPKVIVDTEIVILKKEASPNTKAVVTVYDSASKFSAEEQAPSLRIEHDQITWAANPGGVINIFLDAQQKKLVEKVVTGSTPLEKYFEINVGIKPYQTGKGTPPQTKATVENRPFDSTTKESAEHRQYLRGRDINRYLIEPLEERYIKYGPWLAEPRPAANFNAPVKIFMRQTGDSLVAALDHNQLLCLNNMHVLVPRSQSVNALFFLGIVNSKLLNWFYRSTNPEIGEALAEIKRMHVANLPMKSESSFHESLTNLVMQMLEAKRQNVDAKTDRDRAFFENKCTTLDRQIDELVSRLYGLNLDEMALVDQA
jgi:type I restriction-modification system DNA methylase subunit